MSILDQSLINLQKEVCTLHKHREDQRKAALKILEGTWMTI